MSFTNNASVWYFSKYCNPAMGDTLVGGDKWILKDALANLEAIYGRDVYNAQLVYLNHQGSWYPTSLMGRY